MEMPLRPGTHEIRPPSPQAEPNWRLEVQRKSDSVTVRVPVQRTPYRIVLEGVWTAVWAAAVTFLVVALARWDDAGWARVLPSWPVLIGLLVLLGAAGIPVLLRFLWFVFGSEQYAISEGRLRVRRGLGPLGRWRDFRLDQIRNLRASHLDYRLIYPVWGRWFVSQGANYQIEIDYDGRSCHVARGLTRSEADYVIDLVRAAAATSP